jgi:hypothetical protein
VFLIIGLVFVFEAAFAELLQFGAWSACAYV